jgi:hypothetical protein
LCPGARWPTEKPPTGGTGRGRALGEGGRR